MTIIHKIRVNFQLPPAPRKASSPYARGAYQDYMNKDEVACMRRSKSNASNWEIKTRPPHLAVDV
jgi:hypothetical protein